MTVKYPRYSPKNPEHIPNYAGTRDLNSRYEYRQQNMRRDSSASQKHHNAPLVPSDRPTTSGVHNMMQGSQSKGDVAIAAGNDENVRPGSTTR